MSVNKHLMQDTSLRNCSRSSAFSCANAHPTIWSWDCLGYRVTFAYRLESAALVGGSHLLHGPLELAEENGRDSTRHFLITCLPPEFTHHNFAVSCPITNPQPLCRPGRQMVVVVEIKCACFEQEYNIFVCKRI